MRPYRTTPAAEVSTAVNEKKKGNLKSIVTLCDCDWVTLKVDTVYLPAHAKEEVIRCGHMAGEYWRDCEGLYQIKCLDVSTGSYCQRTSGLYTEPVIVFCLFCVVPVHTCLSFIGDCGTADYWTGNHLVKKKRSHHVTVVVKLKIFTWLHSILTLSAALIDWKAYFRRLSH